MATRGACDLFSFSLLPEYYKSYHISRTKDKLLLFKLLRTTFKSKQLTFIYLSPALHGQTNFYPHDQNLPPAKFVNFW